VIQEREIERVGESRKRHIDIRIIAATHNDLYGLVKSGHFREDLYDRLTVFPIHIPPLRKRWEDIPLLTNHFIRHQDNKSGKHIKGVLPSAMRILIDYDWPANVRELKNAIQHAFVLCAGDQIDLFDLPVGIRQFLYRPVVTRRPNSPGNGHTFGDPAFPRNTDRNPSRLRLEQGRGWQTDGREQDGHMEIYEDVGYSTQKARMMDRAGMCRPGRDYGRS